MRFWKLAVASTLLAWSETPQDVTPNVLLLARIKNHMRDEISYYPLHIRLAIR